MANQKKWLMPNLQSGAFEPERPVTREELIALLNHTASHTSVSKNSDIAPFADAADRPTANGLQWARDRKITEPLTGGDKIDPTAPVSHEELAAVLFQYNAEVQLTGMNGLLVLVSATCSVPVLCTVTLRGLVRTISCWMPRVFSIRPRRLLAWS